VFVLVRTHDRIPGDLEDASSILGGRAFVTARRITIPLALPALPRARWSRSRSDDAVRIARDPTMPAGFHTMTTKIWSLFQYPPN
jgi:iron(III) transport system permease protein